MSQPRDPGRMLRVALNVALESPDAAPALPRSLVALVCDAGLWFEFDHVGVRGKRDLAPAATDTIRRSLGTVTASDMNVAQVGSDDNRLATRIELGVVPWNVRGRALSSLNLTLIVTGAEYDRAAPSFVTNCVAFFDGVARLGSDLPPLSRVATVSALPAEFAVVRPPRDPLWWTPALVHVSDTRTASVVEAFMQPYLERFFDAPVPPGVERRRSQSLVIDVWSTELCEPVKLARDLSDQQAWYAEALELPIAPFFNALGDEQLLLHGVERAAAPLAFYDPATGRGTATVVPEASELDPATLRGVLELMRKRQLTDGRRLERVDILFPSRADAVRLRPRAKELGFARTLYVGDDHTVWNIHPLRSWRDGPSPYRLATLASGLSADDARRVARAADELYPLRDTAPELVARARQLQKNSDYALDILRRALDVIERSSVAGSLQ